MEELHDARDKCALFGIVNSSSASQTTYYGLHALQHRGQESAGIATMTPGVEVKSLFLLQSLRIHA